MRIAIVGTYPPRRCGIATFTADTEAALRHNGAYVEVVEVVNDSDDDVTDTGDGTVISRDDASSYRRAALRLIRDRFDAVIIEHEFGIFGGNEGKYILDFVDDLDVPFLVTLHTVLPKFDRLRADVIRRLCRRAAGVTVFTSTARRLLLQQELVPARLLQIVAHGAPVELYDDYDRRETVELFGLHEDGPVLSTFGLISAGKGIETAIEACAALVKDHPTLVYVVAGRTHPDVLKSEGEAYRESLHQLVEQLGLKNHVKFEDRFLNVREIGQLLTATDVFLTPYRCGDQIVSGALSFALAAGCAVVSTPFLYATDVLADGAGIVVKPDSPDDFASAIQRLLPGGADRAGALRAAHEASRNMSWPNVGERLLAVVQNAIRPTIRSTRPHINLRQVPRTSHLRVLCDDTGVLQHAQNGVPNHKDGYCVDDAGRMLPIAAALGRQSGAEAWQVNEARIISYLGAATAPEGIMRNFMSWDRQWLDEPYKGDHVGRAAWGLGEYVRVGGIYRDRAVEILQTLSPQFLCTPHSRTATYGALGLLAVDEAGVEWAKEPLSALHRRMRSWKPLSNTWEWFEPKLTYDNARIPETLLLMGSRFADEKMIATGEQMLRWYENICRSGDFYRVPGHLGLEFVLDVDASGDEQPLELTALADAAVALWKVTNDDWALEVLDRAWSWFLGNNRLGVAVGNLETGASFDALCASGPNPNSGAESTMAFQRCASTWRQAAEIRNALVERPEMSVV